jgi:acyl carrier protein
MVFEKVQAIIAEKLSVDSETIKLESNLERDFGADSLDAVEIIMGVEEEFEVEVADEDLTKFKCVKDIVEYIEKVKK